MWQATLQVARIVPKEVFIHDLKRNTVLALEHPERPIGLCGVVWDLQRAGQWDLA
jgi:hypothetical protein